MTALGRVDDAAKERALRNADVLCAPSLGGESFGMVLTEAFAAGTPVVASDIAGYRDVVADGVDGLLVPRGDATALAETLRDLALDPARTARLAAGAARSAERYAWPRVADRSSTPTRTRAPFRARGRGAARRGADRRAPGRRRARACRRAGCPRWSRAPAGHARPALRSRARAAGRRRPSAVAVGVVPAVQHIGPAGSATRWCARARPGCCSGWR